MIRPRTNQMEPTGEMQTNNRRILVYKKEYGILFFVIADKRILYFGEDNYRGSNVGDVYLARVDKVVSNIGGFFLRIADKETVFLQENQMKEILYASPKRDGMLREGDNIIVQIKKPKYKNKCALVTTKIDLSPEISDQLKNKAIHTLPCERLYAAPGQLLSYLQKHPLTEDEYVITEHLEAFEMLQEIFCHSQLNKAQCRLYTDSSISMSALYSMEKKLADITSTKIWLKSGGYIYLEPTEAMTVIDVNSGKISKKQLREDTALSINLEAMEEICRQVQCRNISGIVIIDFINMNTIENRNILIEACKNCFRIPNPPMNFVSYTKLGLIEATRVKRGIDIYEFMRKNDKTILL
ncbi:MAG: ribonuclease E/G [Lachnospiraceae bacterium]